MLYLEDNEEPMRDFNTVQKMHYKGEVEHWGDKLKFYLSNLR